MIWSAYSIFAVEVRTRCIAVAEVGPIAMRFWRAFTASQPSNDQPCWSCSPVAGASIEPSAASGAETAPAQTWSRSSIAESPQAGSAPALLHGEAKPDEKKSRWTAAVKPLPAVLNWLDDGAAHTRFPTLMRGDRAGAAGAPGRFR
jgi:hypothetical protein